MYKNWFGIKQPTQVDMPLKQTKQTDQKDSNHLEEDCFNETKSPDRILKTCNIYKIEKEEVKKEYMIFGSRENSSMFW